MPSRWTQLQANTNNAIINGSASAYSTGRLLAAGRSVHDWVSFLRPVYSFPGNITLASCLDRVDKNILYLNFIFLILISSYDELNGIYFKTSNKYTKAHDLFWLLSLPLFSRVLGQGLELGSFLSREEKWGKSGVSRK